ncbi:type I methionyl aminopeptidase [Dietzia psychralcaliphila]|uniref:Methionine aminopeptidase n=1 Tax=Dietzia psychralcaliphila TaxID=139021 RepID=A0AAD0JSP7_9ACTN|nr:type I methionyl aminopeptidase [Dietzia psychralcaliphila]AWH96154.1 type I methionyl aminopeptidase [Dietzia psychralcaliphila]
MFGRSRTSVVTARTPAELDAMEAAGRIVGRALVAAREAAVPGATTADLDSLVDQLIRDAGAVPSFKGYEGFPGSICTSVNEVVVHGIPGPATVLREGDLVSVDCGAVLDGWHGDSAWTFGVGALDPSVALLNQATREVLEEGILAMSPGNRLTDVSHALEMATRRAEQRHGVTLGIVDGFGGHGIGREMHEWPFLANEGKAGKGPRLQEGSVLAVEPMLVLGGETDTRTLADDWTVVTVDGSPSSHWEHTVAVTSDGPRVLTPRPLD